MSKERISEIRKLMADLHQQFHTLNTEVKDLEEVARRTESHVKWKDYKFKVGMYGHKLYPEDKIEEVSDRDREETAVGKSGIVYTNSETRDGYVALMMKDKNEYTRFQTLLTRLNAAATINDEKGKDKERAIKVLLGEPVEDETSAK